MVSLFEAFAKHSAYEVSLLRKFQTENMCKRHPNVGVACGCRIGILGPEIRACNGSIAFVCTVARAPFSVKPYLAQSKKVNSILNGVKPSLNIGEVSIGPNPRCRFVMARAYHVPK